MSEPILFADARATALLGDAIAVLGMTRLQFARAFDVSLRTCARFLAGESPFAEAEMRRLVALVFPADALLAEQLAATIGQTLVSLGLVAPAATPEAKESDRPTPSRTAPPLSARSTQHAIAAIVCAFADAANTTPKRARAGLLAALQSARSLGVSADELEASLRAEADAGVRPRAVPREG